MAAVTGTAGCRGSSFETYFYFENLPYALLSGAVQSTTDQKARQHDFILQTPYQSEVHFKIIAPPGFSPNQLPAPENSNTAGMVYSSSSSRDDDGAIHLNYRFEISQRRLTPSELQGIQAEIRRRFIATGQLITFNHKAADLVALGKTAEALRLAEQEAREHPESALSQMRLAQLLMNSGAGQPALAAARKAIGLDPKSDRAWLTLAYAYERDAFGRLRTGDWNPVEAKSSQKGDCPE